LLPVIEDATIFGSVVYIDSYQNVVTNITRELFEQVRKNRSFEIIPQNYVYKINKINTAYNQTSEGELLAIFNSLGLLEIAIRNGNAAELMNLDTRSKIRIKFHDNQNR
ncbi:MAG: SAM-dependent chlorinase/fluorinase, partial [Bacteroidetes bacterium]|nr:SAM-dependent chlorinase/fluorinase [Bacteroidota bacterium]